MTTKFLSDAQLEGMASRLVGRYESLRERLNGAPVPVERIPKNVACHRTLTQKDLI